MNTQELTDKLKKNTKNTTWDKPDEKTSEGTGTKPKKTPRDTTNKPNEKDETRPPKQKKECYNCGEEGHTWRQCKVPSTSWCDNCEKDSHDTDDCWSKKKQGRRKFSTNGNHQDSRAQDDSDKPSNENKRWCSVCKKDNHNTARCWFAEQKRNAVRGAEGRYNNYNKNNSNDNNNSNKYNDNNNKNSSNKNPHPNPQKRNCTTERDTCFGIRNKAQEFNEG